MSTDLPNRWTRSVSWSKASGYNRCPRQFKYKYIEERDPDQEEPDERRAGTDIHEYFEEYYELHETFDAPQVGIAVDLAKEMFSPERQAEYRPWIEDFHAWNEELHDRWGEYWKPVYTEKWVEVEIAGSTHHGYIDRIQWNPVDESYGVIDYKPNAKDSSHYKGQIAYYSEFLLEVSDLLDEEVGWGGVYGYKDGKLNRWDIHWASKKATKRKIDELLDLEDGFEPEFGYHCSWCDYMEQCALEEEEKGQGLLNVHDN